MKNEQKQRGLKRSLTARHMNMIALGGAIGTGLFVAVGGSLSKAGPGGAIVSYTLIGIMVYFLMTSLGEMSTHCPVSGSFEVYASRYIDPAMGFAMGWNYWYNWAITVAAELAAIPVVMKFFAPDIPGVIWAGLGFTLLLCINLISTKGYGESEFWFGLVKTLTIIIFLITGILMIFGIIGGKSPGFENWVVEDAPFAGGILALINIFMIAGFSFQGTEIVGVAAGESEDPVKNVPKAINTIFWRVMIFYVAAIAIICFIIPYNDPNLLSNSATEMAISPFAIVFQRAGFALAASIMNAIILTSVISCANSGLYVSSRMLYSLAKQGSAPKFLAKVNKNGVPTRAVIITALIGCIAFISSLIGEGTAYICLVIASGLAGFVTWFGIALSHYRFRRAWIAQGKDQNLLKYKAKWFPVGPIFALILCSIVIIGQNVSSLSDFTFLETLVSHVGILLIIAIFLIYKFKHKTKIVPLMEMDLSGSEKSDV